MRRATLFKIAALATSLSIGPMASTASAADAPETYAVVALVGDSLTIVNYEVLYATNLDKNPRQVVKLADGHFDEVATRDASLAIRRASPASTVQAVTLPQPLDVGDASLSGSDGKLPALLDAVRPLLKDADTHYLVVLSRARSDARLQVSNGHIGSGKLTGLGFYVDAVHALRKSSTGERGRGFIAPYAYVQVSLVDLRSGTVVRSETATKSTTQANVGSDASLDPWTAYTAEQKVRMIDSLIGRAVHDAVPHLIAPT